MTKPLAPGAHEADKPFRRLEPEDVWPVLDTMYNIVPADDISPPIPSFIPEVETSDKTLIQSVNRALDILEILAKQPDALRLQDITAGCGLNNSTCHHLLNTLVFRGYVNRRDDNRTYQLGTRLLELAYNYSGPFDLVSESLPELRRLSHELGVTLLLAAFSGSNLTIITRQEPPDNQPMKIIEDISAAAHATAVGKVMLAWLPEPKIARVVADQGLTPFTAKTIGSLATLVESLRQIRRHGFALEDEEFLPGLSGLACALRGDSGEVLGAIGCILPTEEAINTRLQKLQRALSESAALISRRFGHRSERRAASL
ncbi:IclR family transcriptional regulator [Sodalis ligni]|uniref:IclR family transcriptional regulator n=1 Tax=Sodalis ligni TaxID=2697027 RepID=A0A4R1N6C3_9GAMM|nr:IclR family transcriptional regulator [Sodalis ligni]TCL02087.1 IclR family transcriptional regulator [Sodalis ligni]